MQKYDVKEFAELVGLTPQGIYKKIKENSDFREYVIKENGKTLIKIEAKKFFDDENSTSCSTVEQQFNNVEQQVEYIEFLKNELKIKNELIISLQKQNEMLTSTLSGALSNAQLLQAATIKNNEVEQPNSTDIQPIDTENPPKKRGFWARFFGLDEND